MVLYGCGMNPSISEEGMRSRNQLVEHTKWINQILTRSQIIIDQANIIYMKISECWHTFISILWLILYLSVNTLYDSVNGVKVNQRSMIQHHTSQTQSSHNIRWYFLLLIKRERESIHHKDVRAGPVVQGRQCQSDLIIMALDTHTDTKLKILWLCCAVLLCLRVLYSSHDSWLSHDSLIIRHYWIPSPRHFSFLPHAFWRPR